MVVDAITYLLVYGPLAALIAFVLAKRRSPAHPTCRHCGYNLVGATSASDACPECGSQLHAVTVPASSTRWNPWLIVLGILLAAPCVLFFAFLMLLAVFWR